MNEEDILYDMQETADLVDQILKMRGTSGAIILPGTETYPVVVYSAGGVNLKQAMGITILGAAVALKELGLEEEAEELLTSIEHLKDWQAPSES